MQKTEGDTTIREADCANLNPTVVCQNVEIDLANDAAEVPITGTPAAQNLVPLMDLDKGLVGWDSIDDPSNPK